jgi:hypothetical protein
MSIADLRERQAYLRTACANIGRADVPTTRMSFRVTCSTVVGQSGKSASAERPAGQGTPAQVAEDLRRIRLEAGVEAFQINFHDCHSLDQLLTSMDVFMQEVKPAVEQ